MQTFSPLFPEKDFPPENPAQVEASCPLTHFWVAFRSTGAKPLIQVECLPVAEALKLVVQMLVAYQSGLNARTRIAIGISRKESQARLAIVDGQSGPKSKKAKVNVDELLAMFDLDSSEGEEA